jgi:hypothetical protein
MLSDPGLYIPRSSLSLRNAVGLRVHPLGLELVPNGGVWAGWPPPGSMCVWAFLGSEEGGGKGAAIRLHTA